MPEFHKNQVSWSAPEAQKVSLAKPDITPLADAFNTLGRASQEVAEYSQSILDTNARATMSHSVDDFMNELDKENPSDNNYDDALKRFNDGLQYKLGEYDVATRKRFMRDNPEFFAAADLRAKELVFKKQQTFAIQKAKDTVPMLASEVTEGKKPYEQARQELDNMVANMDRATQEQMIFSFDRDVQTTNIKNLVYAGRYSDAIKLLENPKESDTFSAEERTELKASIQKTIEQEAKEREALKKQATKDIDDQLELALVDTLLYKMDNEDTGYFKMQMLLDNPNAKIELLDNKGNVVGSITTKDINPDVRREALKKARTYEEDCMNIRKVSLRANELANNLINQYLVGQGERLTGEKFNQMYEFVNSELFYAIDKDTQKKITSIVDKAVYAANEQVIPYETFRDEKLLYGVGKKWEGPSPAKMVRDITFGRLEKAPNEYTTMARSSWSDVAQNFGAGIDPLQVGTTQSVVGAVLDRRGNDQETRWQRQLTSVLRDNYKKETGKDVVYGSELEYLMNVYADALAMNGAEREMVGLAGINDYQIGLTYKRMLGVLEAQGQTDIIIGQGMSGEDATKIRDGIFNDFLNLSNNMHEPALKQEQKDAKQRWYDNLATVTYGKGGAAFNYTPTEFTTHQESKVYSTPLTKMIQQQSKKAKQGEQ
jgi:hypothetical protein